MSWAQLLTGPLQFSCWSLASWLRLHNPTLNGLLELFKSGVPLVTKDACSKLFLPFYPPHHIRSTKRLNSSQARWSLVFTQFNPLLPPRVPHTKPNALSRQFQYEMKTNPGLEFILLESCHIIMGYLGN